MRYNDRILLIWFICFLIHYSQVRTQLYKFFCLFDCLQVEKFPCLTWFKYNHEVLARKLTLHNLMLKFMARDLTRLTFNIRFWLLFALRNPLDNVKPVCEMSRLQKKEGIKLLFWIGNFSNNCERAWARCLSWYRCIAMCSDPPAPTGLGRAPPHTTRGSDNALYKADQGGTNNPG